MEHSNNTNGTGYTGNNDDDFKDDDDDGFDTTTTPATSTTVRVYQPMQYKTYPKKVMPPNNYNNSNHTHLTSTLIGGSRMSHSINNCISENSNSDSNTNSITTTTTTNTNTITTCAICQEVLYPLVQYYNSIEEYTIQVLACNRPSCYQTLFPFVPPPSSHPSDITSSVTRSNGLHYGGNGVVVARCIRIVPTNRNSTESSVPVMETSQNEWTCTDNNVESTDWRMNTTNDTTTTATNDHRNQNKYQNQEQEKDDQNMDLDELESQLAAIEAQSIQLSTSSSVKQSTKKNTKPNNSNSTRREQPSDDGFPCFMLHGLQEPPAIPTTYHHHDDDDAMTLQDEVGLSGNSKNDQQKIQRMLQQYMEEMEDDTDLLHLLQQQQHSTSSPSLQYHGTSKQKEPQQHRSGERDERLSDLDRALFTYTDRLKRIPRQVMRHVGGGGHASVPIWSMYVVFVLCVYCFCREGSTIQNQKVTLSTHPTAPLVISVTICFGFYFQTNHFTPTATKTTDVNEQAQQGQ